MKIFNFIAVDFDGTLCIHEFPAIGAPIPHVIDYIKYQHKNGCKIILHTCREDGESGGDYLTQAVNWCKEQGVPIDAVNENPFVKFGKRKIYADIYIDDRAVHIDSIPMMERCEAVERGG